MVRAPAPPASQPLARPSLRRPSLRRVELKCLTRRAPAASRRNSGEHYVGNITQLDKAADTVHILYDDGDEADEVLSDGAVRLIGDVETTAAANTEAAAASTEPAAVKTEAAAVETETAAVETETEAAATEAVVAVKAEPPVLADAEALEQPPKAVSAYMLFAATQRGKDDLPKAVPEQAKVIGARWKALSDDSEEKKQFQAEATAQKAAKVAWLATEAGKKWAAADKAMKEEKRAKKAEKDAAKAEKDAAKAEKSAGMSAEQSWIASRRKAKRKELVEGGNEKPSAKQVTKALEEDWNKLPETEKASLREAKEVEKSELAKKRPAPAPAAPVAPAAEAAAEAAADPSPERRPAKKKRTGGLGSIIEQLQEYEEAQVPLIQQVTAELQSSNGKEFAQQLKTAITLTDHDDGQDPAGDSDDGQLQARPSSAFSSFMDTAGSDNGAPAAETKQSSKKKSVPKTSPKKPAGPIGKKRTAGGSGKGKGLHGGGKGKSLHGGGKGKMSLHGGAKVDSRVTVED